MNVFKFRLFATFPFFLILTCVYSTGCTKKADDSWKKTEIIDMDKIVSTDGNSGMLFDILTGKSTGLDFNNEVISNYKVNVHYNSYAFNGAGVGIGDLNNDGLPDVYMAGNWVPDRIYLNKGDLKFEDVTPKTGISAHDGYSTGVTMVDINNDGYLDIYVCRDWFKEKGKKNDVLFINNGDMTFTESAEEWGLIFDAYSTQANFFDYDNDGDLDLYVATHPDDWNDKLKLKYFVKIENGDNQSDFFFRNDGNKFTDISKEAGINNHGYGLSATVGDINNDGFLDVYVANDFAMYDFLYMNNGDGTFTDETKEMLRHNSQFAMGADLVDVNNDGLLDIYTVDMDLEDNYTVKTFTFVTRKEQFEAMENGGYHSQYVGNVLQLNNGNGNFTEMARMAGISTSGWSWSPMFADYDNDGDRDLFISNGNGQDFHVDNTVGYHRLRRATRIGDSVMYEQLLEKYPTHPLVTPNGMFENNGDLSFTDQRHGWGTYFPSASYGAARGDLDGDGDVDIITNNINLSAFIYRNNSTELKPENHWLEVSYAGPDKNVLGIGTRLELYIGNNTLFEQHTNVRGYMSCNEPVSHFGIGTADQVDHLVITWPDGKRQVMNDVAANQKITVDYTSANEQVDIRNLHPFKTDEQLFNQVAANSMGIEFVHKENEYDDFDREFLIPHKLSYLGPGIAVADVNGDGRSDFYIGAAQGSKGALYIQGADGKFKLQNSPAIDADAGSEDMGVLFFDADNDGDQDLYVGSGGSDYQAGVAALQDRLYLNDGKGNFTKKEGALPEMYTSTSSVTANDFDQDGDLDLFVASRVKPGHYPDPERGYLLRNDNGQFVDVTKELAPELEFPGMISAALWSDYDGDQLPDLLLAGEWTALKVYHNTGGGKLVKVKDTGVEDLTGWWNSLAAGDFDNDGDMDYIGGNFGINCKYKPGDEGSIEVFADDFDGNGTNDIILGYYQNGVLYPIKSRERMVEQCPVLLDKIPTWDAYGKSTIFDLFGKEAMENARQHLDAQTFRTTYFRNDGNGHFSAQKIHNLLQVSTVYGMVVADLNRDGNLDLITQGNYYYPEVETNRQDASVGQVLLGNGDGTFNALSTMQSGFLSHLDAKSLVWIKESNNNEPLLLSSNNNGPVLVHSLKEAKGAFVYAEATDRWGEIVQSNGKVTRLEFPLGSGYLSQGAYPVWIPETASSIRFYNNSGQAREVWPALNASK
jgi:enediyne biosynthesis protein E4